MRKPSLSLASVFAVAALIAPALHADTLLMQRVQQERTSDLPGRGQSMAQVEGRFGAPITKLDPRGGDTTLHPVINRWEYPNFIVYFERDRVISSVMKQAAPNERGPKQR